MLARNCLDGLPVSAQARLRKGTQPKWFPPMLATLTHQPFSRDGWPFEPKLDGERCLVFRQGDDIRLFSRNHKPLNLKYPELTQAFRNQNTACFIIDGEIVTFERGVASFAKLQPRMQVDRPSTELRCRVPVWFYAFDLLYFAMYDARQVPLRYRRALLRKALNFNDPLRLTECRETEGEAYYRKACSKRWEGVVAKNGDSVYVSQRSRNWLKLKCVNEQEFVIGGYTEPKGRRLGLGALLVGYYDTGKLIYAGKVGTGYNSAALLHLSEQLSTLETSACPFVGDGMPHHGVHWVKPKLIAEIGFTEWTQGGKLRHPRFLGLRTDKKPHEVVREK
jgi:bifunctional non-homologous end joining protein LigD